MNLPSSIRSRDLLPARQFTVAHHATKLPSLPEPRKEIGHDYAEAIEESLIKIRACKEEADEKRRVPMVDYRAVEDLFFVPKEEDRERDPVLDAQIWAYEVRVETGDWVTLIFGNSKKLLKCAVNRFAKQKRRWVQRIVVHYNQSRDTLRVLIANAIRTAFTAFTGVPEDEIRAYERANNRSWEAQVRQGDPDFKPKRVVPDATWKNHQPVFA